MMLYETEESLLYKAKEAEGKTFGEIDKSGRIQNERAKGHLGQIVEESFFGYEVNSNKEADFENLGIELKVTPIKKNKNGTISAKERLVLNIINYHEEVAHEFTNSSFWKKNEKLLLMFYEWIPKVERSQYKILKSHLHTYPEDDLEVIKKDWEIIVKKIKEGRAHELSEADTNYLGACTKGASKASLRSQPFNNELAMQRAFSLKQSYMTALIRQLFTKKDLVQFSSSSELKEKSIEEILHEKFTPYIGMSIDSIATKTNQIINWKSKGFLQQFVSGLLGIKGTKLNQIEEFEKANIKLKTIRLEPNGIPKEHMSFKNIDFIEWAHQHWDESWLKNHFEETKFLFVVFEYEETLKQNPNRQLYFKGIRLWNMPKKIIDNTLKSFWLKTQDILVSGVELTPIKQKNRTIVKNNLPKAGENGMFHIRPKGRNAKDTTPLPDGREISKQCFWFDREFVVTLIKEIGDD